MKQHSRQDMIDALVGFSLESAVRDPEAGWLREMFANGFAGFATMSDAQLLREMQFRGLSAYDDGVEPGDETEPGDDADSDEDHDLLGGLLPYGRFDPLPE